MAAKFAFRYYQPTYLNPFIQLLGTGARWQFLSPMPTASSVFSVSTYTGDQRIVSIRLRYDRLVVDYISPSDSSALLASIAGSVSVDGDPLADREEAVPWLRAAGLLPADAVISNSEHAALLRLRDALRDVLDARSAGMAAPDSSARLTRALADGRLVVTVSPSGKAVLVSSARAPYSNLVAAIAIAVADAW